MKRLSLLLLTVILAITTCAAAQFTVNAVPQSVRNGQRGILFKINIQAIPGPVKEGAWLMMEFADNNGNRIKHSGKNLMIYGAINLPYTSNTFNNCELFLPYNQAPKGTFKYFVTVQSKAAPQKNIAQSGWFTYNTATSSSTPSKPSASNQTPQKPTTNPSSKKATVVKTEKKPIYGGFEIHTTWSNGAKNIATWMPCTTCHATLTCQNCYGRGVCASCQGRGGMVTAMGNWLPCYLCGQTGRCSLCKGTGKCFCTTIGDQTYPGYSKLGEMIITADGHSQYFSYYSGSGSSSSSSSGSHSHSSGTCSHCHGTGVEANPMYVDDPSGAAVNAIPGGNVGYQHTGSGACRYCGKYQYHVHLKCYKCR